MKVITGMQFQGKLDFAMQLAKASQLDIADGRNCSLYEIQTKIIVSHFHIFIKRMVEEQLSFIEQIDKMLRYNPEVIVVADTIAYGFTMDEFELRWREQAANAMIYLAQQAQEVYQVICGIGVKIKG